MKSRHGCYLLVLLLTKVDHELAGGSIVDLDVDIGGCSGHHHLHGLLHLPRLVVLVQRQGASGGTEGLD